MPPLLDSDQLAQRLGHFEPQQFALDAVRLTEQRQAGPDLPEESFRWRVTRRMQGDQTLGRTMPKNVVITVDHSPKA